MDELETREIALPEHVWRRIEAEVATLDTVITPEQWIRNLIYRQFSYLQDLEGDSLHLNARYYVRGRGKPRPYPEDE